MTARTAEQGGAHDRVGAEGIVSSSAADMRGPIEDELRSLREAIEDLRGRQGAHYDQLQAVALDMAAMRGFREHTESELSKLRIDLSMLASVVDELAGLPAEIRVHFEPELIDVQRELSKQASLFSDGDARTEVKTNASQGQAIEAAEQSGDVGAEIELPTFGVPEQRSDWLSTAIGAIAESRSPSLAGELVSEIVPLHATLCDTPLTYELRIDDAGSFLVQIGGGYATVLPANDGSQVVADFRLQGPATAFAMLAGGGLRGGRGGLRVRGSRRAARRLMAACRRPVALADLVHADVKVWPGLLLAAIVEAVDPRWTKGAAFVVAYEIAGAPAVIFDVKALDGAPLAVSARVANQPAPAAPAAPPSATVRLGERAFLSMLAGVALPQGEQAIVFGDQDAARTLLGWFAKAQGLTGV